MNTIQSIENLIINKSGKLSQKELRGVWDKVWVDHKANSYSEYRDYKTKFKVQNLVNLGIDFSNKNILDIGCGDGSLLRYLNTKYNSFCYGVDISEEVISKAQAQKDLNINFLQGDHRDLSAYSDNFFDIVISLGVIEHFKEYGLALTEARRVLKPGGKLILIQPHLLSFGFIQKNILRFTGRWRFGKQYDFSVFYYRKLLSLCGFKNIKTQTHIPFSDMKITMYLDMVLKKMIPFWGHYLYLIAVK